MGNHIAVTKNGKHVIGKKLFVTDENGKHRKGKKAFLTVGGVFRQVFAAGHDWAKYNCVVTPAHYEEQGEGGHYWVNYVPTTIDLYNSYNFTTEDGYVGEGKTTYHYTDDLSGTVGAYFVTGDMVVEITSLTKSSGGGRMALDGEIVASCKWVNDAYSKGSESFGTFFADEGKLPEDGTLLAGSVAEGYYVLEIGGVKYYYELVE